ncbi:MAG: hypothetical protein JSV16_01075 [Candidatus Hydrogenedentota bacterium]|nr:MAG: hypothetical protein JSV16_01075 [Candidatus Hydrogenedentota bacterium]
MQKVAVIGCGITKFKARWLEKTYFELAFDWQKTRGEGSARYSCADVINRQRSN